MFVTQPHEFFGPDDTSLKLVYLQLVHHIGWHDVDLFSAKLPKILVIAGSDPSGGAGIQADIKTATTHKTYCGVVANCLTAQNTKKVLAEMKISNMKDMQVAALKIKALGAKNVLIKGGHLNFSDGKIHSILLDEKNKFHQISNKKVGTKNLHGTGCTLASALSYNIAKKIEIVAATRKANQCVYRSIVLYQTKNLLIALTSSFW